MDHKVLATVETIVRTTLGLGSERQLSAATPLFGMPELDSFAVVELAMAIEQEFGISIDGDDFNAELFETIGSLAAYVSARTRERRGSSYATVN